MKEVNVRSLRNSFGFVSQEPVLFDGTIESNIKLGWDNVSRDSVVLACKQVSSQFANFVTRFSSGVKNVSDIDLYFFSVRIYCSDI